MRMSPRRLALRDEHVSVLLPGGARGSVPRSCRCLQEELWLFWGGRKINQIDNSAMTFTFTAVLSCSHDIRDDR